MTLYENDMPFWLSSKRPQIASTGEDVEKREPSYTVGGNVNCGSRYAEQDGGPLIN